jgi:hypothetical protein
MGELMKSKSFALTIISAIWFLIAAVSPSIQFCKANWLLPPQERPNAPILIINSLVGNETQGTSDVELNFTVYVEGWNEYSYANLSWIGYRLDEEPYVWYVGGYGTPQTNNNGLTAFHFSMKLTGLNDGIHSLTTSATYIGKYSPAPYKVKNFSVTGYSKTHVFWIGTHTIPEFPTAAVEQYTPADYIPEFPSWIILPLFLIVTIFAGLIKRKFSICQSKKHGF